MLGRVSREVWIGLAALLFAGGASSGAEAAALNTEAFVAACVSDPVVTDEPGLAEGSKVTPKIYCDCIAGKLGDNKLSQADVDMLNLTDDVDHAVSLMVRARERRTSR